MPRLIETLATRGHAVEPEAPGRGRAAEGPLTRVLGPGDPPEVVRSSLRDGAPGRLLVLSLAGAHPDARSPLLQRLWALEEAARAGAAPVLVLRLAPLIGPRSPLWLRLRGACPARLAERLAMPVLESDVVETLERALAGRAAWEGWYEVAGPEPMTFGELAAAARSAPPSPEARAGDWEPPLEVLAEQRLCDPLPWMRHFAIEPVSAAAWARGRAA